MEKHLIRSKSLLFTIIAVPLLLIIFISLIYIQQERITALKRENIALQEQNAQLRSQGEFYRSAYQTTLDDIRSLSAIYGGQKRYAEVADELRRQELEAAGLNTSAEQRTIKNPGIWSEYKARGAIHTECLQPIRVDTASDRVLVSIDARSTGAELQAYLDGNAMAQFDQEARFEVMLPEGLHELSIVSRNGSAQATKVLFDTQAIELNLTTVDSGRDWAIFDCNSTQPGPAIAKPGALRILIDKR
jgi:hypothetical protein